MLQFRNLSLDYRIGIYMRGYQPITLNLRPGETKVIDGNYMKKWSNAVKEEVAMYVDKGLLEVYDITGAVVLTAAAIIAYA
jgi:hypothetical protein